MGNDFVTFLFLLLLLAATYIGGHAMAAPAVGLALFVAVILLREHRERARQDFINQLRGCRSELRAGGTVVVDNLLLRYDTELTTYHLCIGLLLETVLIPSRYQPATGEAHHESVLYSLCSLFSGWWAFPSGPMLTLGVIQRNLTGGERTVVALLIDEKLFAEPRTPSDTILIRETSEQTHSTPTTGEGSASQRELEREGGISSSWEERILEWQNPTPPGAAAVRRVKEKLRRRQEKNKRS